MRFHKLVALHRVSSRPGSVKIRYLFQCDCGNQKEVDIENAKNNNTHSCGCLWESEHKEYSKSHGESKTRIYTLWMAMKMRCMNKNQAEYVNYGGRGIAICKRWLVFENFRDDMGCPLRGYSLDRIDNSKGYYKKNCRWATLKEQNNNTRRCRIITYKGISKNITQWEEYFGAYKQAFRTYAKTRTDEEVIAHLFAKYGSYRGPR